MVLNIALSLKMKVFLLFYLRAIYKNIKRCYTILFKGKDDWNVFAIILLLVKKYVQGKGVYEFNNDNVLLRRR